ncbi:MAG: nitrogen regulatory protein 1, partial [Pseudomonadota bacterium]|nr:nitrogen regulatory protein 1 [Pseudomonadota bacterium]
EVIYIVVPSEQADRMFERIFVTAKLDTPGMGILWMTNLEKMATYVPHEVAARFGVHAEPRK